MWSAQVFEPWSLRRPLVSIVMGLDQHRAQITADWLDTETGEVRRARVAPADRAGVRGFLERFRGRELEVALEATTGLAVRGRGAASDRRRRAPGRAGGDGRAQGAEEAREGRPGGRSPSARAVDGQAAAGVVDPARSHVGLARPGAAAAHVV